MSSLFFDEWECPHYWEDVAEGEGIVYQKCLNCHSVQEEEAKAGE